MVKQFQLTYLAKGGGGGGGGWRWFPPPLEIFTIAYLTFCLVLTDRQTLDLPDYKVKVVNICKMHWTWVLEVVVDRFQWYVEIV